jgi:hypothetical protein
MPDGDDPMYDHDFFIKGMVWADVTLRKKNAAPPQRHPLTEEEISSAWYSAVRTASFEGNVTKHFARAIERKHGIGGDHE